MKGVNAAQTDRFDGGCPEWVIPLVITTVRDMAKTNSRKLKHAVINAILRKTVFIANSTFCPSSILALATTQIYIHVMQKPDVNFQSPSDRL